MVLLDYLIAKKAEYFAKRRAKRDARAIIDSAKAVIASGEVDSVCATRGCRFSEDGDRIRHFCGKGARA